MEIRFTSLFIPLKHGQYSPWYNGYLICHPWGEIYIMDLISWYYNGSSLHLSRYTKNTNYNPLFSLQNPLIKLTHSNRQTTHLLFPEVGVYVSSPGSLLLFMQKLGKTTTLCSVYARSAGTQQGLWVHRDMMTPTNEAFSRIPLTKASDAELWCFFDLCLE